MELNTITSHTHTHTHIQTHTQTHTPTHYTATMTNGRGYTWSLHAHWNTCIVVYTTHNYKHKGSHWSSKDESCGVTFNFKHSVLRNLFVYTVALCDLRVQRTWIPGIELSATTTFPDTFTQIPYGVLNKRSSPPSSLTFAPCGERIVRRCSFDDVTRTKPSVSTATHVGLIRGTSPFSPNSESSCTCGE